MEIKNFGDLKKAILEGKEIQEDIGNNGDYSKVLDQRRNILMGERKCRTKPEPEYIPFIPDDWREFNNLEVKAKPENMVKAHGDNIFDIISWHSNGLFLQNIYDRAGNWDICLTYGKLLEEYCFLQTGKPCGKQITK